MEVPDNTYVGIPARFAALVLCCVPLAVAQSSEQWDLGADIGYGWYHNGTIFSPDGTAKAGIRNRFAAGIFLGDDFSKYVSAEIRYLYHDGHPFLTYNGVTTDIQGQSMALTYDMLFHFQPRESRVRWYLLGGMGGKDYVIAGPEPFPQPAPQVASLTTNDVWKVVFAAGGGVKFRIRDHLVARGELLNYITTFPRQQTVPAPHNTARGVFVEFTPMFGLSYTF